MSRIGPGRVYVIAVPSLLLALTVGLLWGCAADEPDLPTPGTAASTAPGPTEAAVPRVESSPAGNLSSAPNVIAEATGTVDTGRAAAMGESGPAGPLTTPAESEATPTPPPTATAKPSGPRTKVVALDPGHGGPETGAAAYGLVEKDVNLSIALKLAELLRAEGYEVVLTRDTDRAVSPLYKGGGYPGGLTRDVQARVDIANEAGADVFLSIHNNGSNDPGESGTEVWYNKDRTFADRNLALANLVQDALLERIRALGHPAVDRGIKDDSNFRIYRGRAYNIYVLGPGDGARRHVPTQMPGVLGESLFISNAADAAMLSQERTLDAIAGGYRDAVVAYFAQFPD